MKFLTFIENKWYNTEGIKKPKAKLKQKWHLDGQLQKALKAMA